MLPAVLFAGLFGFLAWRNNPFSKAATANCYGQPGTHTAVAPSTVTSGKSFKITNITGSANSNIATVKSTKLTYSVSGATPTAPTGSWNGGPVSGDYTSHYPDLSLTANGSVGSKVTVSVSAIDANITLAGHDATITCSVANGQLTANSAGQSLTLASVKIVAPASSSANSSSNNSPTSNSNSKSTDKTAAPTKTSDKTTTPTSDNTDSNTEDLLNTEQSTSQTVEVTVVDSKGQPVKDASVVVDSLPAVKTDAAGKASFNNLEFGQHDLSVIANGRTVSQELNVSGEAGSVLGVSVSMPAPTHKLRDIGIGAAVVVLALIGAGIWFFKFRHRPPRLPVNELPTTPDSPPEQPTMPASSPASSLTESTLVQPGGKVVQAPPAETIPTEPPQLNNDKKLQP